MTDSPFDWSNKYGMPIIIMVPDDETAIAITRDEHGKTEALACRQEGGNEKEYWGSVIPEASGKNVEQAPIEAREIISKNKNILYIYNTFSLINNDGTQYKVSGIVAEDIGDLHPKSTITRELFFSINSQDYKNCRGLQVLNIRINGENKALVIEF